MVASVKVLLCELDLLLTETSLNVLPSTCHLIKCQCMNKSYSSILTMFFDIRWSFSLVDKENGYILC